MNTFWIVLAVLLVAAIVFMLMYFRKKAINTYYSTASFQDVETALVDAIAAEGWKLLSMHDIQSRLVNAGYDCRRIAVYEICRPDYAAAVLKDDRNKKFSSLMPCRVSLFELHDGTTGLSMINAGLLATIFGGVVMKTMNRAAAESEIIIKKTIKQVER